MKWTLICAVAFTLATQGAFASNCESAEYQEALSEMLEAEYAPQRYKDRTGQEMSSSEKSEYEARAQRASEVVSRLKASMDADCR